MANTQARHKSLVNAVKRAIVDLHSDTTVSPTQTIESMEEIREELDARITTLREENQ